MRPVVTHTECYFPSRYQCNSLLFLSFFFSFFFSFVFPLCLLFSVGFSSFLSLYFFYYFLTLSLLRYAPQTLCNLLTLKKKDSLWSRMNVNVTDISSEVGDCSQRRPKGSLFNTYYTEGTTPFSWLLPFTIDTYLIMLSVKLGDIMYHFFKCFVWLDLVSRTIGEHSTH